MLNLSAAGAARTALDGAAATRNSRENVLLNLSKGGLLLERHDDLLAASAVDTSLFRTYNSQGGLSDATPGQQWKIGLVKQVRNAGTATLGRVDEHGDVTLFAFDSERHLYVSSDAGKQAQSLSAAAGGHWIWRDEGRPGSGVYELYDSAADGRILEAGDAAGAQLRYTYNDDGLVSQIGNAHGDVTHLSYDAYGNVETLAGVDRQAGPGICVRRGAAYHHQRQGHANRHQLCV